MKALLLLSLCLALLGCNSGTGIEKLNTKHVKIRKQVYDLTLADLREHPVWEFALDEEDKKGQDEATVRPFDGSSPVDPATGMFIVRARFTLADGTPHFGYLTPADDPRDLGAIQPQIITDRGQVGFWMGIVIQDTAPLYGVLGKSPAQTFPISFESDVPIIRGSLKGSIPAFLHLDDSNRVKEIK
jgi:hypothetical protein